MRHAAFNFHAHLRHSSKLVRVVGISEEGFGEIESDLRIHHVKRGRDFHIVNVIAAEVDVHETGDAVSLFGVLIIDQSLHEGRGAVAHAHDSHADFPFTFFCHETNPFL